jgi:hypothetical protein
VNWKDDLKNSLGINNFDLNSLIVNDKSHKKPYLMHFYPKYKAYRPSSRYALIVLKIKLTDPSFKGYVIRDDRTHSELVKDYGSIYPIGEAKNLNLLPFKLLPDLSMLTNEERKIIKKAINEMNK